MNIGDRYENRVTRELATVEEVNTVSVCIKTESLERRWIMKREFVQRWKRVSG